MLRNYFITAWRNLKRNRAYTVVNILGLALGIASGIIIFSLIDFQLGLDNFHPHADRTYRIVSELHGNKITYSEGTPIPLGKAFQDDYAYAERVVRVADFNDQLITLPAEPGRQRFKDESGVTYVDPSFFDIFYFPLAYGTAGSALAQPNTAVITKKLAKRYFDTEDAVGKVFQLNNGEHFTVVGVLNDKPLNTSLRHEIYLSYANLKDSNADNWGAIFGNMQVFITLARGVSKEAVDRALTGLSKKYYQSGEAEVHRFTLQPLADIHFNESLGNPHAKRYLWALALVGLLLIVTSCVNFVNLATAQAINRNKEVGLRKIMGSSRAQLFWQFIVETALVTLAAMVLTNLLANIALTALSTYADIQLSITFLNNWRFAVFVIATFLLMVVLSGFYPAMVIVGVQPLASLSNKLSAHQTNTFSLRKALITFQLIIAQILVISTIVITKQIDFSTNADLGFDKQDMVMLPIPAHDEVKMSTLRTRFETIPAVSGVTFCFSAPASGSNMTTGVRYANRDQDEPWGINMKYGDDQYLSVFDIPVVAGRNLFPADTTRELLVNETFVKKLGIEDPREVIGQRISINGGTITAPIVGVMKDFYNYSFRSEIAPTCVLSDVDDYRNCAVKVHSDDVAATLRSLEQVWNEVYPEHLYSFQFLDERIAGFYQNDIMILRLIQVFAALAVFISCLGLYGMVSFMALRKTKEIGVRKVLGASVQRILWLFGREFGKLVLLAFLVAAPVAWWGMHLYLQGFTYRIALDFGIFILALSVTTVIAVATVCYRATAAALANPAETLRTE